jgi:hypothetical protein
MNHYVTLFDSNFLPQGLALYESMAHHANPFTLWVLCMDEKAEQVLNRLRKPGVRLIPLAEVETPQLLGVKQNRTRVEYCWTLTPFTPKFVFDRDSSAERVTYLDADMFFLRSPVPVHEEFQSQEKSVLITEHAYDAGNDRTVTSGQYCVQFMTFVRDKSETVRQWWEARCLEWCSATRSKGRYGDQKYLDDWPSRFPDDVHVLQQLHAFLGPWNAKRFHYSSGIAWHFHGLRLLKDGNVQLHPGYSLSREVEAAVYGPYVQALRHSLEQVGEPVAQQPLTGVRLILPDWLKAVARGGLRVARDLRMIQ